MKLIRKHQSGSKFIKPDITNKSDYFNKSNIASKNIPSIEELIKKQSDQFNNAVLSQKGTLTNLGGSPDTDNRTQYERNKDYLNSNFNAEKFERGGGSEVKELPKLIKRTNLKDTDFIKRLLDPNRKSISD